MVLSALVALLPSRVTVQTRLHAVFFHVNNCVITSPWTTILKKKHHFVPNCFAEGKIKAKFGREWIVSKSPLRSWNTGLYCTCFVSIWSDLLLPAYFMTHLHFCLSCTLSDTKAPKPKMVLWASEMTVLKCNQEIQINTRQRHCIPNRYLSPTHYLCVSKLCLKIGPCEMKLPLALPCAVPNRTACVRNRSLSQW